MLPYIEALQDNANFEEGSSTYNFLENIDPGLGAAARDRDPLMDKQTIKDYVFDYTDPLEYATLPFLAPKLAMKGKKIFDAVRGPGGNLSQNLRGIGAYIGTDILARDVLGYENPFGDKEDKIGSDPFFTQQEDGTYVSTRPLPDAQDEANEDLKDVNEKEEEEKEKSKLSKLGEALSELAALGEPGQMSSGYMIEGTGIATPEIRRYEAGGIASLEPEMMADGGIAKFFNGGKVVKGALNKGRKYLADRKQKKADVAQEKADKAKAKVDEAEAKAKKAEAKAKKAETEVKETGVTKDKPEGPGYLDFVPGAYAGLITGASKKAMDAARAAKGKTKPIVGAIGAYGVPAAVGYGAYDYFSNPTTDNNNNNDDSGDAAPVNIQESDALKDIIYQNSLERATSAGRTEPSFIDYLASFPGSYTEKVGKDPEFARQMMAGFMAMMKPTEGFVPRNALVDFGEAAMAEQVRQEDARPDQLQLIEELSNNPELLESFTKFNRATNPLSGEELANDIDFIESSIKEVLYQKGSSKKPILQKGSTEKGSPRAISKLELYQMYQSLPGNPSDRLSGLLKLVERQA